MGAVEYPKPYWVLALAMGWVLLSTLTLSGSSSCGGMGAVNNENKGAKKELSTGMGAVEYPNPIGF